MFSHDDLNCLYRYCISLVGDETQAYDLLQTSLEKFLKTNANSVSKPIAYVKKIIRNQHIDECRKNSKHEQEEYDDTVMYLDADIRCLENIVASEYQVQAIWQKLSSSEREIMYFWAVEGYSTSELAELLDISRGTLLSKIHRLRKRLEHYIDDSSKVGIL